MTWVEAFTWTFIYMGMAVGALTVLIVWAAVLYDNEEE
jgi:ABC-type sugar transport system permease subunit